jgi:hypothetical protein
VAVYSEPAVIIKLKFNAMANTTGKNNSYPLVQLVKNFINKLTQTPDIYPIKYYKKNKRPGKNRNLLLI